MSNYIMVNMFFIDFIIYLYCPIDEDTKKTYCM